jgi:sugar lactone lactonase YvrE
MFGKRSLAVAGVAVVWLAVTAAPALASVPPVSGARVAVHFDLAAGQQPENIVLEPDGAADVTFAFIGEVARVTRDGDIRVLSALPAPPPGSVTPILGTPSFLGGIALGGDGTRYVNYSTGTTALNGIWRTRPGGQPTRIVALPADSFANGLALDQRAGTLYVADSALGVIWRAPVSGGPAVVWASGPQLQKTGFLGANGIKVHDGAVWVSNTDQATLLRIPVLPGGSAGPIETAASGLTSIDDFTFSTGDTVLAALDGVSELALIRPDGTSTIVLTAADGLSNPTSVAVSGDTIYVPSAAYLTGADPNLLIAHLTR